MILGFSCGGGFLVGYKDGELCLWHVDLSRSLAITCNPLAKLAFHTGKGSVQYPALPCLTCPFHSMQSRGYEEEELSSSQQLNLTVLNSVSETMLCVISTPNIQASSLCAHGDCVDQAKFTLICCPVPPSESLESGKGPVLRCCKLEYYVDADAPRGDQHFCDLPIPQRHLLVLNCGNMIRFLELSSASDTSVQHRNGISPASYFPPDVNFLPTNDSWFNTSSPLDEEEVIAAASQFKSNDDIEICSSSIAAHARLLTETSFECEGFVRTLLAAQLRKGGSLVDFHMRVVDPLYRPPRSDVGLVANETINWAQFALVSIVVEVRARNDGERLHVGTKRHCPVNQALSSYVGILAAISWRDGSIAVMKTLKLQGPAGSKDRTRMTTPELLAQLANRVLTLARNDTKLVCPQRATIRGRALDNTAVTRGKPLCRLVNPVLPIVLGQ